MSPKKETYAQMRARLDAEWAAERYEVKVEVAPGMSRWRTLYRLRVTRAGLSYGPEYTHCWYGGNPTRLRRKGQRIAARLNAKLDRDYGVSK